MSELQHKLVESQDRNEHTAKVPQRIENFLARQSILLPVAPDHPTNDVIRAHLLEQTHQGPVVSAIADHHRRILAKECPQGLGPIATEPTHVLGTVHRPQKQIPVDLRDQRPTHLGTDEADQVFVADNEWLGGGIEGESVRHEVVEVRCDHDTVPSPSEDLG